VIFGANELHFSNGQLPPCDVAVDNIGKLPLLFTVTFPSHFDIISFYRSTAVQLACRYGGALWHSSLVIEFSMFSGASCVLDLRWSQSSRLSSTCFIF
jgi:hypothetical protein